MANSQDQQYCLRWNNFQANITSQFEALRDDEEFTDVTIACEGKRLQAHKVVLSACSPFFKELFKTNPCSHPIIFMRDVEALHVAALMEFMYAGEVNIAQAHLSSFLKTAESLKIRGLTDTSTESELRTFLNQKPSSSCSNAVSSSQDQDENYHPPEAKRLKPDLADNLPLEVNEDSSKNKLNNENSMVNPFAIQHQIEAEENRTKIELPDYMSADEDRGEIHGLNGFFPEFSGGMEIIPQTSNNNKEASTEEAPNPGLRSRKRHKSHKWLPEESPSKAMKKTRLIQLGEGIEIYEDQLRSVKWSDYRKLTRGLATILFSPAELATCSVTGQRWSRAGNGERPVKPALDRAKVQAIISYVATRFPMVEISRIKQVLAYKCKENSTAFKMKAVRYYGDTNPK